MKRRSFLILLILFGLIPAFPAQALPTLDYTYQYGFIADQSAGRYVFRDGRAWVTNADGLWGQIDREGNVVLPFAWESVSDLGEGRFGVESAEAGRDIIDGEGRSILAGKAPFSRGLFDLEYFTRFSEGLCRVEYDGVWYFIDPDGKIALEGTNRIGEAEYLHVEDDFSNGRAPVILNAYGGENDGLWGYIGTSGKLVSPCQWNYAVGYREGIAVVETEAGSAFINGKGDYLNNYRWQIAQSFHNGRAAVMKNGLWGYVNKQGMPVIPCKWMEADAFSENRAAVLNENGWGFIDGDGVLVIPCEWRDAGAFREGSAPVMNQDKLWGLINIYGNPVTPCQWKRVGCFGDGLAMVMDETGRQGYINRKGDLVIPCEWDEAGIFEDGLAWVAKAGGERGFINAKGDLVIEVKD